MEISMTPLFSCKSCPAVSSNFAAAERHKEQTGHCYETPCHRCQGRGKVPKHADECYGDCEGSSCPVERRCECRTGKGRKIA